MRPGHSPEVSGRFLQREPIWHTHLFILLESENVYGIHGETTGHGYCQKWSKGRRNDQ
jgi:hypothetical protein